MMRRIGTIVALLMSTEIAHAADGDIKLTLNAGEAPDDTPWTQPASFAFTSNRAPNAKDSWAVAVAGKVERSFNGSTSGWIKLVANKNTQEKKEVANYSAGVGFNRWIVLPSDTLPKWSVLSKNGVSYVDKTVYPNGDLCKATGLDKDCRKRLETSVRATSEWQPYNVAWDVPPAYAGGDHAQVVEPAYWTSLVPSVIFFHDELINAKVNAAGVEPTGGVGGAKLSVLATASPKWSKYRLIGSIYAQHIETAYRSKTRAPDFERSTNVAKVSLTYELGKRSFVTKKGWIPAVGVTHTVGDDPLEAKLDQDNTVFSFKLTYKQ